MGNSLADGGQLQDVAGLLVGDVAGDGHFGRDVQHLFDEFDRALGGAARLLARLMDEHDHAEGERDQHQ